MVHKWPFPDSGIIGMLQLPPALYISLFRVYRLLILYIQIAFLAQYDWTRHIRSQSRTMGNARYTSSFEAKNTDSGSYTGLIIPRDQLCFPSFTEEKLQQQRPKRPAPGKPALQTNWKGGDHVSTVEGLLLIINAWLASRGLSGRLPRIGSQANRHLVWKIGSFKGWMMYPRTKREKSCSAALQAITFQGPGCIDRMIAPTNTIYISYEKLP